MPAMELGPTIIFSDKSIFFFSVLVRRNQIYGKLESGWWNKYTTDRRLTYRRFQSESVALYAERGASINFDWTWCKDQIWTIERVSLWIERCRLQMHLKATIKIPPDSQTKKKETKFNKNAENQGSSHVDTRSDVSGLAPQPTGLLSAQSKDCRQS